MTTRSDSAADTRAPGREAVGLVLAYLAADDDLVAEILRRYSLGPAELALLLGAVSLVGYGRARDEVAEDLYELALERALT